MKAFMHNWKTSLAGGAAVLIPVVNHFMPMMPPEYAAVASGVVAGLGLIVAADAKA